MAFMTKAVILHGTGGSPEGNWFRWLENELRAKGLAVWLPELPHAEQPSLREEIEFVRRNAPFTLDAETVIIGHSSGASLALALASGAHEPFGALVAVSPFVPTTDSYAATEWEANAKLFDVDIDLAAVRRNAWQRLVVHSDNDPYIPLDVATYIATACDAEFVMIPGQGHFNFEQSENYQKFPLLLSLLIQRGIVSNTLIQIVDENDVPVRAGTRQEAQAEGLWHRIVRIVVEDEQGNILLQKRAPTLLMNPNLWDNAASGHVDAGEDWLEAAKRELAEEIGLTGVELREWRRYTYERETPDGLKLRRFNRTYRVSASHDTTFTLQPEEVSEVRWYTSEELQQLLDNHPELVTTGLQKTVEDL